MEQYLTIGEVSRLLNIPEPTLRFWQEKGIFEVPQGKNYYRKYTVADLINIAEIAFYRNMGLPVKQMEHFNQFSLEDYDKILTDVKGTLEEKIDMYLNMYKSVQLKGRHLKSIEHLKTVDYIYDTVPFDTIVGFEYSDREKLIKYTRNPSLYVRCMDTRDLDHDVRGILTEKVESHDTLIWQKKEDKQYAVFLVEEIASENYVNNIPEKLAILHKKHETGQLIVNFLLSETAGEKRIDYLKAYAEILS